MNKELTLLQEYFQKIQNLSLEIVQFSFWIHSSKTFTIQNGNTEEVIQYLKEIQYDGGTQFGALDLSKYKCDEFLLVSDGISNFGSSELKLSDTPLYALNSSSIAEHSYLEYISRNSGGSLSQSDAIGICRFNSDSNQSNVFFFCLLAFPKTIYKRYILLCQQLYSKIFLLQGSWKAIMLN